MREGSAEKNPQSNREGSRVFSSTYWVSGPRTDCGLWRALAGEMRAGLPPGSGHLGKGKVLDCLYLPLLARKYLK